MKSKITSIKDLAIISISVALSVIFSLFEVDVLNVKISFDAIPIIIIALIYRPGISFLSGLFVELVSQLVKWGLTFTTILWIIPVGVRVLIISLVCLCIDLTKKQNMIYLFITLIVSSIVVTILNTVMIGIDGLLYGYYSKAILFANLLLRFIVGIVSSCLYGAISLPIINVLKNNNLIK